MVGGHEKAGDSGPDKFTALVNFSVLDDVATSGREALLVAARLVPSADKDSLLENK